MNWDELKQRVQEIIPTASMDTDYDGQIMFYTGLIEDENSDDGDLVEYVG